MAFPAAVYATCFLPDRDYPKTLAYYNYVHVYVHDKESKWKEKTKESFDKQAPRNEALKAAKMNNNATHNVWQRTKSLYTGG
jgi:hypothetical protein